MIFKQKKASIVVTDPHGDLSEELLGLRICKAQKERIVYIDPYLSKRQTPTINPFDIYDKSEENIDLLTQELVRVFKELLPNHLSLQMEAVLTPCIATVLRKQNGSLSMLQRFMDDEKNADLIAAGLKSPNPSHQSFFAQAFQKTDYRVTKLAIYTRIQSLLNHRVFREMIDGKSTINLKKCIDSKKIIIFNLAQGKMGSEVSSTYGKFVIALVTSIALKRAYQPKFLRVPTYLFIDEFHNYLTESIEKIFAETRKYRLHLVVANQSLFQIDSTRFRNVML